MPFQRILIALVHAIDPGLGFAPESGIAASDLVSLAEQEGRALLAAFPRRARLTTAPYEFMEVGKPADVILEVAAEWKADMIVIASHGRGGMRRLVLGSVAEAVMRRPIARYSSYEPGNRSAGAGHTG